MAMLRKLSCRLPLISLLLLLVGCDWFKGQEIEQPVILPPETREGRNTFGCRFNSKAWVPEIQGYQNDSFNWSYDAFYAEGNLNLEVSNKRKGWGLIRFTTGYTNKLGDYDLSDKERIEIIAGGYEKGCGFRTEPRDSVTFVEGRLTITRLDNEVVAGRFWFTLHKPGCDTLKVTDGRFDLKLN